jgi:predicted lysophospholipase L1 biosynthesis ABC-type transport system permease subunit
MKALGAPNSLVAGIFLAEQVLLACIGGAVGFLVPARGLARLLGEKIFGTASRNASGAVPGGPDDCRAGGRGGQPDSFAARLAFRSRHDSEGRIVFGRLLLGLVRGSRGRLLVALVALTSAAAVLSALANVDLDVEKKLTQQFRTLGANLVIAPARADQAASPCRAQLFRSSQPGVDAGKRRR